MIELHNTDCLGLMSTMPDNSVDAIVTDPPYFKVKGEAWDNQWENHAEFIAWIGELSKQWQRILRPNGSLYCFASPKMASRVEVKIAERFEVLMNIVWNKPNPGRGAQSEKEAMRNWWPMSERIVFAEHFGADNIAKGDAGYEAKCDELRGFVFEPLRAYLDGERLAAGMSRQACDMACGNQMSGHYFSSVQWTLPTKANYNKLRELFNGTGDGYLRREYEELRREYEELRRPFNVTADVQYTDVWTFKPVQYYDGKHVCEKPLALMEHIIIASTRPGAVVFDPFMGSGSTGVACVLNGRSFIGCELDPKHFKDASARIHNHQAQPRLFADDVEKEPEQLTMFTNQPLP